MPPGRAHKRRLVCGIRYKDVNKMFGAVARNHKWMDF